MTGKKVLVDLGVIDPSHEGFVDANRRKRTPIIPVTGPMERIVVIPISAYGDSFFCRMAHEPIATGAGNWTRMIQRLVARALNNPTPDQVSRKDLEPTAQDNINRNGIRRTLADWLDERVSTPAISAVMGHFEISAGHADTSSNPEAPRPISTRE